MNCKALVKLYKEQIKLIVLLHTTRVLHKVWVIKLQRVLRPRSIKTWSVWMCSPLIRPEKLR